MSSKYLTSSTFWHPLSLFYANHAIIDDMSPNQERILIVENDPEVGDLIARQALKPLGYAIKVVAGAPQAIQQAANYSPDVIITNVNLPGLSGKDLLVALSSQGAQVPVIVIAKEGEEADVIQTFRLGATDYLQSPLRETEIVSAVERALKQVRARRERERLATKLEKTNRELKRRVRDLTTIFDIGKTVTSVTDQQALFKQIIASAVYVTDADKGWLQLRKGDRRALLLSAVKNMPESISSKLNQQWDDSISSLVALSGEVLSIHGEPLKRFKVARIGKAALVVPVKAHDEVIGVFVVMREKPAPFDAGTQAMLEAVADYASVTLVSARLFQALEERAQSLQAAADSSQKSEKLKDEMIHAISEQLSAPVIEIENDLIELSSIDASSFDEYISRKLDRFQANIAKIKQMIDTLSQLNSVEIPEETIKE